MNERALKLFSEAWNSIKSGNLFDEQTNTTFEYMIKPLWKSQYQKQIKSDILKHFPAIYSHARTSENPPPLFYILISLRDPEIIKEMQSLLLLDWIKSNADENSTYQILNFTQTFAEKQIPIDNFVHTIIKRITLSQHRDMIEALSHMLTIQFPQYMTLFLHRFLELSKQDDTLLKNYVHMNGRRAFLELVKIAPPALMNKVFKSIN
jgi:hypothetical protein